MSHEDQPRTSSSGAIIIIVAVVVMLLVGGLVVLGLAGLSFFWLSAEHRVMEPPRMIEQPIMVQPARPVELTPELHAPTMAEAPPPGTDGQKFAVKLDAQGKILADGQTVDVGGLKDLLVKAREDGALRLEVVVQVDRQCRFEHVAAVQAVCREAGVENVRVQALTTSSD